MKEPMKIENITVVGAGTMGHGIAQLFAQAGFQVTLNDLSLKILEKAVPRIQDSLHRLVNHGIINPEDADEVPGRITITTDLEKYDVSGRQVFQNEYPFYRHIFSAPHHFYLSI